MGGRCEQLCGPTRRFDECTHDCFLEIACWDTERPCAALTPIVVYYGDNVPLQPMANPGQDNWRIRLEMTKLWVAAVNRHGGDATLVHLPEIGIRGNTHLPFSDLNNQQIADLVSQFLATKRLN